MNVLITGSSRGIGLEFVRQFLAKENVQRVYAVTQNVAALQSSLAGADVSKLVCLELSVSNPLHRSKLAESLSGVALDLLINNAGVYPEESSKFEDITLDDLRLGFDVNVGSTLSVTQACLPALKRAKLARVVSISSLMGSIEDNSSGGHYAYRMSKAALNMFSKSLAVSFPQMISVAFHPGWVRTDMGGPSAPLLPKDSVRQMIQLMDSLTLKHSGQFLNYDGETLPW